MNISPDKTEKSESSDGYPVKHTVKCPDRHPRHPALYSVFASQRDESGIELGRRLYAIAAIFCFVFYLVYNVFSHGVHSPYMTWLFLWPLLLGFVPATVLALVHRLPGPSEISAFLYNAGVAALTVSSCLRGIFQIAGTTSVYQVSLMMFGAAAAAAGVVMYAAGIVVNKYFKFTV